jgi:hypothetical protein
MFPNNPSLEPNYRQRQAAEAIERAAIDFDIAIRGHVPDGEVADHARKTIRALAQALKAEVMAEKR